MSACCTDSKKQRQTWRHFASRKGRKAEKLGRLGCKVLMPFETPPENHNHGATVMQWLAADGPISAAQLELTSVVKCIQMFMRHLSQPVAKPGSLAKPAASVKAVSDIQLQHAQRPAAQHSDLEGLSTQAVNTPVGTCSSHRGTVMQHQSTAALGWAK
ncbi:TPA: hypothetical protein ACH3X3_003300 [Trebouxia sp. C0006]